LQWREKLRISRRKTSRWTVLNVERERTSFHWGKRTGAVFMNDGDKEARCLVINKSFAAVLCTVQKTYSKNQRLLQKDFGDFLHQLPRKAKDSFSSPINTVRQKNMEIWITYLAGAVVAIGVTLTLWSKNREWRQNRRGWRVSLGIDAIRYVEKTHESMWESISIKPMLEGREGSVSGAILRSAEDWKSTYPDWARDRRDEIIKRLRSEFPYLALSEEPNRVAGSD
jgi:hypothetical protein